MYCVRCGVKLGDGETECPLCHTALPVVGEESGASYTAYSDRYPKEKDNEKYLVLGIITTVMAAACLICLILCLKTFGRVYWSGYVMLGIALAWTTFVLPFFFRKWYPLIFLPIDFAAVAGYLLYICLSLGQHWYLSFAFPLTLITCALTLTAVSLLRYIKKGRIFIVGGLLVGLGSISMLVEFFQHITFRTPMFVWSLYCVIFFSALGLFFIISAIIPPLRAFLERKFFI
ncbi:MAG: hypothetical protein ILO42_02450 [Clostridia bacterium]|nr:hypothetical protein [Clostridia bacterium]